MEMPIRIVYVTSSEHKRLENGVFVEACTIGGKRIKDLFTFDIVQSVQPKEILEVDISLMVRQEVMEAYRRVKEPCIVEHAGLLFEDYSSYPGGLTKPMWNALGSKFIEETRAKGRKARAKAVVAYCDGQRIHTFDGETKGTISDSPRGNTEFYWDTVFIPDTDDVAVKGKTYAEIVDDSSLGLEVKITRFSQSARAMLRFLEYRLHNSPALWPKP